jgi:hypothetical protein
MLSTIRKLLSGIDNVTPDIGRWLWLAGFVAYNGFQGYAILKGQPWSPQEYAFGLGTILALGGVGVAVKASTEPKATTPKASDPSYGESLSEAAK